MRSTLPYPACRACIGSARKTPARIFIVLGIALGAWSCAESPTRETVQPPPGETEIAPLIQAQSLELPASPFRERFNAVESALKASDWMTASVALQAVPLTELSAEDDAYVAYLQARIAWTRGDRQQALGLLNAATREANSRGLAYRIASFRHYMLSLGGDTLESARLASQILKGTPGPRGVAWKQRAWRDLQRTSSEQLSLELEAAVDAEWIAWLQLAQDVRGNPSTLSTTLADWLALHADHPAANPLPGGLEHARQLQPPGQVALLLPLSGRLAPAGEAVLNGYLAAHYAARQPGGPPVELRVLDITTFPAATAAYDAAVLGGAQMVIGPLDKSAVAELAVRADRRVPVLALNRIDTPTVPAASALVQLSLAPEDEAITLAELAYGRGGRSALIISPAGPHGAELEETLRARWSALGGRVAGTANYTGRDDISESVKNALGLSTSEQRARTLGDYLAMDLEFTPRRRADADVIFLLSRNGAEARSIKPLLAFHYAGELPVYALSSVYGGEPNDRNLDLDGIHLVEMPWLLGESAELRVALAAADYGSGNTTRLNALGADAHLVGTGFARLRGGAEALFRGHTGLLDMDPDLKIHRELSPATFDGGDLRRE